MNKLEKYFEELKSIKGNIAIINDKPVECDINESWTADCSKCKRNKSDGECSNKILIEWLAEEYVEKPELTLNEHKLCQVLKNGWLARDKFNGLIFHIKKPLTKDDIEWIPSASVFKISDSMFEDTKFKFIKWEDKEPWRVEDLLKLKIEF